MTKTPFSSPSILIYDFKIEKTMFSEFINRILENERVVVPSHQEKAEPDVIGKKTAENQEIKIPKKYQEDIQTLRNMYGESFKTGLCINLSLQDALRILPRERKRLDGYTGLVSFLRKMGIELNIKSQKSKED